MRKFLLITTFLVAAHGSPTLSQEPLTCSNFQTSAFDVEAPSFNEESAFDLQIRQEADGYHLRITGDNVILSEATASSLIADSANAKTGLKTLTIDARQLRLESPLSFVDANIRIIGDEIVVAGDAQINLLPSGNNQTRSLTIIANTLKFENSRRRPFDLQFTQGGGATAEFVLLAAFSNSTRIDTAEVERAFMETLNGQIVQQIVSGAGTEDVDPAYIPITLTSLPSQVPERVTDVKVVSASFSVPSSAIGDNAISFSVVHPGYGEMRRRSGCAIGDFRSRPDDWRFFTTFFEQIDPDWSREEPRALELSTETRGRYYAFLPAQTMYHMVVGVHSKNWRRIPRLTDITLGFEVME